MDNQTFITTLIHQQLLSPDLLLEAGNQAKAENISLITYLLKQTSIPKDELAKTIAAAFDLPYIDLDRVKLSELTLTKVDEKIIQQHHVLPIQHTDNKLILAIADPTQSHVINTIKFHTGLTVESVIVAIDKLNTMIEKLRKNTLASAIVVNAEQEEHSIIDYVNRILQEAIHKNVSDIHIEPQSANYSIRFRQDGVLYPLLKLPVIQAKKMTVRLKIMAHLDIAEQRLPQDGRFNITSKSNQIMDCRLSTCPTLYGEKIVIRILNKTDTALTLTELGLNTVQQNTIEQALQKPQGMILVTGPTGSGKTITLYSALHYLNSTRINISTVEDPIEIELPGINQVNIHPKAGLDFATVLRAFLRQDPDILMIGEIRDKETADIAIKAAQTGHLVLSTLHTNSAAETITRLMNMGMLNYNLASSLSLIIAQRLVRCLCSQCKLPMECPEQLSIELFQQNKTIIYKPNGCEHCYQGYKGRTGIFEILLITESVKNQILQHANLLDLIQQQKAEGYINLRDAGLEKVKQGLTSLEELDRVLKD